MPPAYYFFRVKLFKIRIENLYENAKPPINTHEGWIFEMYSVKGSSYDIYKIMALGLNKF